MIGVDSDDIDDALLARLNGDATLRSLCPDGAYLHMAPANTRRYVLVTITLAQDRPLFGGRGFEAIVYTVQAILLTSASGDADAAGLRIDQLLEGVPLAATGYCGMACFREERIGFIEVDDVDPSIRWQHRGGQYRVEMSLLSPGV